MNKKYYCNKCKQYHKLNNSGIGKIHLKYKSKNINQVIDWRLKYPIFSRKLDKHIFPSNEYNFIKKNNIPIEIILYNQKLLKSKFGNVMTIYKGLGDGVVYASKANANKFINVTIKKYVTSWSTSKWIAYCFTETYNNNGKVISANIKVDDVLLSHYSSKQLYNSMEYEIIINRYPKLSNIQIYDAEVFKKKYKLHNR